MTIQRTLLSRLNIERGEERQIAVLLGLACNLGGYVLVLAILWVLITFTGEKWPVFVFTAWSDIGWLVTSLTLWGLAGRLLNLRQAKRLYGLVGAGIGIAAVVGGKRMICRRSCR